MRALSTSSFLEKVQTWFQRPFHLRAPSTMNPLLPCTETAPSAEELDLLLRQLAVDSDRAHQRAVLLALIKSYHGNGSYFFELLDCLKKMRRQGGASQQKACRVQRCIAAVLDDHWQANLRGGIYVRGNALFGVPVLEGLPAATLETIDSLNAFDVLAGDVEYGRYYRNQGMLYLLARLVALLNTPLSEWRCHVNGGEWMIYEELVKTLEEMRYLDRLGMGEAVFSIYSAWFYLNNSLINYVPSCDFEQSSSLKALQKNAYAYCERYLQLFAKWIEKKQCLWVYDYYATSGDGRFVAWMASHEDYKKFCTIIIHQCYTFYLQGANERALCLWATILPWLSKAKTTDEERYFAACLYVARLLLLLQIQYNPKQEKLENSHSIAAADDDSLVMQIEAIQPLLKEGSAGFASRRLLPSVLNRLQIALKKKSETVKILCSQLLNIIEKPASLVFDLQRKKLQTDLDALQAHYQRIAAKRLEQACFYNFPQALEVFFYKTWEAVGVFIAVDEPVELNSDLLYALLGTKQIAQQRALPMGALGFIFYARTLFAFHLVMKKCAKQAVEEEAKQQQMETAANMLREAYLEILKAILLIPHSTVILNNYYGVERSEYTASTVYTRYALFNRRSKVNAVSDYLREQMQTLGDARLSHLPTIEAEAMRWYQGLTGGGLESSLM